MPVAGFPGYFVSDAGRVLSTKTVRVLSPAFGKNGYPAVSIRRQFRQHHRYISRLVCEAFHGPSPTDRHQAAHLDGDPKNNVLANLTWASPSENNAHKRIHGTLPIGSRVGSSRLTESAVSQIKIALSNASPIRALARSFGVEPKTIRRIRDGETWRHISPKGKQS